MSSERQECHGLYHAHNPTSRRDFNYTENRWVACVLNPCPSRDHRRASASTLRQTGLRVISRQQLPPNSRLRTASAVSSRATSPTPEESRASASTEQIVPETPGPSVALRTPVFTETELPEETPRPSRTIQTPVLGDTENPQPSRTMASETAALNRNTMEPEQEQSDDDRDVKVAKPSQYDGSPKKFRIWWVQMRNYIEMQPHKIRTDRAKVGTILSFMQEGTAAKWAYLQLEKFLDKGYPDYDEFRQGIEAMFKPTMLKEQARTELDRLEQGTKTVDEYNTEASLLFADAEIQDELEAVRIYRRGLKRAIRQRIEDLPRTTRPATLTGWMVRANEIDQDWRAFQDEHKTQTPKTPRSTNPKPTTTRTPTARASVLTMQERQRLQKAGLCFRCKQPGHIASDTNYHPDARSRPPQTKPTSTKQETRNRTTATTATGTDHEDNVSEGQRTTNSRNRTMDRRTTVVDDRSEEGDDEGSESNTSTVRTRRVRANIRRTTGELGESSKNTTKQSGGRSTQKRRAEMEGKLESRFRKLARDAKTLGYNSEDISYLIESDSDF